MHCGKCPALMAAFKSCKSLKCQTCFRCYNCRKAQVDGLHAWQQDKKKYLVPPKPPGQRQWFMPVAVIVNCRCSHKVKWSSWETVASRLPYIAPSTNFEVFMLKGFFFQSPEGDHLLLWRPNSWFKYLSLNGVISPKASATLEVNIFCNNSHLKPDG